MQSEVGVDCSDACSEAAFGSTCVTNAASEHWGSTTATISEPVSPSAGSRLPFQQPRQVAGSLLVRRIPDA